MSDEEVGSWYAVGVDSCLVPFASELERIDCRTRLLRQRYSEATARYKERVRQSIYNNYWTD
ncbi:MAG: hypothetical protein JMN24_18425 [gamma proteobacterium endosymbiont of Lamellibrachia anaximandri]|nr:hypothetical protein [gamma proteobacterium endosymbiont of Lamellibrachia anaximandri]MBL3618309.1 hypothetical protein [gamma proteobacterium endosymbiont of Lamellibrachia anaximandri]